MDDLISRKDALEYLDKRRTYELMDGRNKAYGKGIRDAMKDIENQPTIPAVPLDKLCEWLANSFSDPPCCVLENVQCKMECRGFTQMNYSECWKYVLTKWMEGLG